MPVNGMSKHDFDMLQRRQMTGSDPVQTQNQTVSMPSGGQTVQMPNNGQTVQMPAMQTVQMPQTARQSLLAKQDPPQTWYSGEYPTMREVYARAYQIGQTDRAAAESILTDMQTLQKDPSSVYFNPYTQATNSAVENLRAAGVDTSREGWQDEYSWLKNYYRFGTGGSPLAPTKKSSAEEQAAYWYYQYMNDEDTTVQAENEWAALQEEVGYWAGRKDRNYSDEEILGKIDWSNYPTLQRMDEGRKSGTPVYINRGIGYSEDALYGVIWNARNGEAGSDPMAGAIHYAMGDGTGYTADPDIAGKLDAGSDLYAPYSVGSTAPMDEAALYFGVDHFDAQWIEDNKWMRSSSDATVRKYYAQVVDAEDRTAKAEAEQANLDAYIEKQLSYGSDPERILKNVRSMMEGDNDAWDGCPTLLKMDDSLRTGELLGTTRALGYRWEDIEANVRLRCAEKNGNSLRDNVGKIREMLGVGRMPVEAQNSSSETPDVQNEEEPVPTGTEAPAATQAPETAAPEGSKSEQTINDPMGAFRDGVPEVTDVVNTPALQQTPTAEEQPAETTAPPTEATAPTVNDPFGAFRDGVPKVTELPAETEKPATEQEAKAGPAETPKPATEQEASVSHGAHVASATPTAGPAPTSTPRPPQENYESQNSKISAAGSVIADIGTEEEQAVWETASDYGFEEAVTDIGDAVENGNPDPEAAYQSALDTANQNAGRNYADAIVTISDHDEAVENRTAAVAGLEAMGLRYDEESHDLVAIDGESKTVGSLDIPALLSAWDAEEDKTAASAAFMRSIEGDIGAVRAAYPSLTYGWNNENIWDVYDQYAAEADEDQTAMDIILAVPNVAELFATSIGSAMRGATENPLVGLDQEQLTQARRYQYAIQQSDETLSRITDEKYNAAVAARDSVYADYRYADDAYETFSGKSRHADETGYQAVKRLTGIPSAENEWPTSGVIEFASQYRNYQATDWSAASFYNDFVGLEANGRTYTYDDIASVAVGRKQQNLDEMARLDYVLDRIDTDGLRVPADWRRNLQRRYDALQADNQAADYFLLRKNADFDEKVAAFNLDEVGKDNPIYIKERGWITTAVGIVGEAFTRKAQKAQAMSDDEARTYKYLYVDKGEEAAEAYLASLDNVLTMRIAQDDSAMYERMSTGWGWIPMNVLSIMESPLRLAGTGYSALQLFKGEEINPYANAFSANRLTQGVQAGTNTTIENSFGKGILGGAVKLAYSGGYSGFESLYGNFVFGGLGGVHIPYSGSNKILQRVVDSADEVFAAFPMGLNAAGGSMQNAAYAKADNNQIFAIGLTTGLAESITEAISFGNMDNAKEIADGAFAAGGMNAKSFGAGFRKWLGVLPGDMASEIVGEVTNDAIEEYFDQTVMGENSEFERTKQAYIESGYGPDEAENLAWGQVYQGFLYTALSTVFSTAVSGAVSVGGESIQQHRENRQLTPDQLAPSATPVQAPGTMTTADLQDVLHGTQQPAFNPDDQNFNQPEETQQAATEAEETAQEEQTVPETEGTAEQAEEQAEGQAAQAPGGLTREELTEAALAPRDFTPTEESDAAAQAQLAAQAPQGAEIEQEQQATTRQAEPQGAEISQEQVTNTTKQAETSPEAAEAERAAQVADRVNQYNRRIMKFQMAMRSQTGNTPAQTATLAAFLSSQTRNSKYDETAIAAAQHLISRFGERTGGIINALGSQLRSRAERQKTGANYTEILKYAALGNGKTSQVLEAAANGQINADTVNNLLAALKNDKQNPEVAAAMQEAVRTNRISRQVAKLIGLGAMDTIAPFQQAVDTARQARDTAQQRLEASQREQQAVGENLEAATGAYLENPTDQLARGQYQQAVNDVTGQAAVVQENEQSVENAEESLQTAKSQLKDKQAEAMAEVRQQATETVDQQMAQEAQDDARQRAQKGNKGTAYVGSTPIEFHYEVIDRDGLISSHSGQQLGQNPAYPAELQPRNRDTESSRSQIQGIANDLVPARLGESTDVQNGAPIVGPDYVVESGNGRVAAIESSPHRAEYTAWLRENAESFGINPDSVTDNSILVRVRDTDVDRQQFVQAANESTTASYSATETAKADAQKMADDIIDLYNPDTDLNSRANAAFINALMQRVIPQNEQNDVFDSRGRLSQNGINRIRNALFQKAFGSTTLTQALSESTNEKVRNILNALTAIAPQMAKLNQRMADNEIGSYPLAEAITRAVLDVKQARDTNTPIEAVTGQFSMLEDESTAASRAIAGFMDSNKRSGKNVQRVLTNLIDTLNTTVPADPNQITMPGMDMTPRTLDQIVEDVVARTAEDIADEKSGQVKGQQSMFEEQAAPEETPQETARQRTPRTYDEILAMPDSLRKFNLLENRLMKLQHHGEDFFKAQEEYRRLFPLYRGGKGTEQTAQAEADAAAPTYTVETKSATDKTLIATTAEGETRYPLLYSAAQFDRIKREETGISGIVSDGNGNRYVLYESGIAAPYSLAYKYNTANVKTWERNHQESGERFLHGPNIHKAQSDAFAEEQRQAQQKKKLESPVRIAQNLADSLGIGHGFGVRKQNSERNIPAKILGYYQSFANALRVTSKEAGNFMTTMHEMFHAIGQRTGFTGTKDMVDNLPAVFTKNGYKPSELADEAFAEFGWRWMMSESMGRAFAGDLFVDAFEQALARDTKAQKALNEARDNLQAFLNADIHSRMGAVIRDSKGTAIFKPSFFRNVINGVVDNSRGAIQVDRMTGSRDIEQAALHRNFADTIAFHQLDGKLTDAQGTIIGDGLGQRFEKAGVKTREDMDLLNEYMLLQHSLDRDKQDKPVFDGNVFPTNERKARIKEIEKNHPEIKAAADAFWQFDREFKQAWMVDTGLVSQKDYDAMQKMYPHYVPTNRVMDNSEEMGGEMLKGVGTFAVRAAKGSTLDVRNPMESYVKQVSQIVRAAKNNQVAQAFDHAYRTTPGMGLFATDITGDSRVTNLTEVQKKVKDAFSGRLSKDVLNDVLETIGNKLIVATDTASGNNIVTVHNADGTTRFYEMHNKALYDTITGLKNQDAGLALRTLAKMTRMMSALTTGSNPLFAARNFARDFQNSVNYGTWASNYATGMAKWLKAAYEVWRRKGKYEEYEAMGGGGWNRIGIDRKSKTDTMNALFKKYYRGTAAGTVGHGLGKLWNAATLERLNGVVETASRYVEYAYGKHDLSTAEGRREAFLAGQDVTVDFHRTGNSQLATTLKALIPFFNANLQGTWRTARQFTKEERARTPQRFAKTVINTAIMSALSAGLLHAGLGDDDKEAYAEYLTDEMKAQHFYLPNFAPSVFGDAPLIRIPLEQDPLAYAVHGIVTNGIWKGTDDEFVMSAASIADTILNNVRPVNGTVLDPMIAFGTNKNYYGGNIVPGYMEDTPAYLQYKEETPGIFKGASNLLYKMSGGKVNVSPLMLQYAAEQYTGFVGQLAIPFMSHNKDGSLGGFSAAFTSAQGRFTSDPYKTTQVVSSMYDGRSLLKDAITAIDSGDEALMLRGGLTPEEITQAHADATKLTQKGGAVYEAASHISANYDLIDQIEAGEGEYAGLNRHEKNLLIRDVRKDSVLTALNANEAIGEWKAKYVTGGTILGNMMTRQIGAASTKYDLLDPVFKDDEDQPYMQTVKAVWDATGGKVTLPNPGTEFNSDNVTYKIDPAHRDEVLSFYRGSYMELVDAAGIDAGGLGDEDYLAAAKKAVNGCSTKAWNATKTWIQENHPDWLSQ